MTALVTTREIGVNRTTQGFSSRHGGRASGHDHYEGGPGVKPGLRGSRRSGAAWVSSSAHLSIASSAGGQGGWEARSGWRISFGAVKRPGGSWRLPEQRMVTGEHVPDRLGEETGELNLGDPS